MPEGVDALNPHEIEGSLGVLSPLFDVLDNVGYWEKMSDRDGEMFSAMLGMMVEDDSPITKKWESDLEQGQYDLAEPDRLGRPDFQRPTTPVITESIVGVFDASREGQKLTRIPRRQLRIKCSRFMSGKDGGGYLAGIQGVLQNVRENMWGDYQFDRMQMLTKFFGNIFSHEVSIQFNKAIYDETANRVLPPDTKGSIKLVRSMIGDIKLYTGEVDEGGEIVPSLVVEKGSKDEDSWEKIFEFFHKLTFGNSGDFEDINEYYGY